MKRAILISCYYPPDGGVGVQRPRRLAEQARDNGWDLTIVTRQPPANRSSWEPEDDSLTMGDEVTRVLRVPMDPASTAGAMVPGNEAKDDPFLSSILEAVKAELSHSSYDAVIITMPPYGMAPLVPALRACSQVPIFVDLRDPWALDGACSYSNKAQWATTHRWMHEVLGIADGVIANTPEAGLQIAKAIDGLSPEDVAVVNNGCDIESFQGPMPPRPESMPTEGLHLVHTGTLHSKAFERTRGLIGQIRKRRNFRVEDVQIGGRTAYYLFRAMALLASDEPALVEDVRLTLVGVEDDSTRRIAENSPCRDQVHLTGFVPYQESVAWIRHADALFLPLFGLPKGHRSRIIPYKTYEYLASGRPILGALPEGDARDLVDQSGRGHCADPCDERALAGALRSVIEQAQSIGRQTPPLDPFVHDLDWPKQCTRFFDFLEHQTDKMTNRRAGASA